MVTDYVNCMCAMQNMLFLLTYCIQVRFIEGCILIIMLGFSKCFGKYTNNSLLS